MPSAHRVLPATQGPARGRGKVLNKPTRALILLAGCWLVGGSAYQRQKSTNQQGPLDNLFLLQETRTRRISSYDKTGGNTDFVVILPGQTRTLAEISGAGVIRRFYLAPYAQDRMRYRKVMLRMYWDGQNDPCVEVPIGDFFGSGLGTLRTFHSLPISVNPGFRGLDFDGMVSYFPMPFEKGARITVQNDGNVQDFALWFHVEYEEYPQGQMPGNAGRFHAQWRRSPKTAVGTTSAKNSQLGNIADKNTTGADNYVILDANQQGSFVGFFLTIDNIVGGWYGEGDDMIFIDGEQWPPSYPGTGTEEIFDAGCCPDGEFWGPYTGFYLIENLNGNWGGKNQMYRFYLNNPVHFQKSIRVTLEHGHANNFENDYTTTSFWYQKEPHLAFPSLPVASARVPGWPEGVAASIEKEADFATAFGRLQRAGKIHMSPADASEWQQLETARNKDFRALHYRDYLRDVAAAEKVFSRYGNAGAK